MLFRLKHNDGKIHLNDYWIDDEFSIRYWESRSEADSFAERVTRDGFILVVEEYDENITSNSG